MATHYLHTETETLSDSAYNETVESKVYSWDDASDQVSVKITVTDRNPHKGTERERVFSNDIIPYSTCPQSVKNKIEKLKAEKQK